MLWCACDMHHDVKRFTEYVAFLRGQEKRQGETRQEGEAQEEADLGEENDRTGDNPCGLHPDGKETQEECPSEGSHQKADRGGEEDTQQTQKESLDCPKRNNSTRRCENACDNVYYNVNRIWSPNFNRPLGDIGRKLILKEIRELHYKDAAKTTSLLLREGLDYGKVRFMKVSELYHYMYALGVFEYAVKISLEFGSNIRMSSVVSQGNYRSTCNNLNKGYDFCFICCSHKNHSVSFIPGGVVLAEHRLYLQSYSTAVEELAARRAGKAGEAWKAAETGKATETVETAETAESPTRKFLPAGGVGCSVGSGVSISPSSPSSRLSCEEDASPVERTSAREQLATQAETYGGTHVGMVNPDYATTC